MIVPLITPPPIINPPPVVIPPGEPPCDPHVEVCDDPEDPPTDAPEPGLLVILLAAILAFWRFGLRRA